MDRQLEELLAAIECELKRARSLRSGTRSYTHKYFMQLHWEALPRVTQRDAALCRSALEPRGYAELSVRPLEHFVRQLRPAKALAFEISSAMRAAMGDEYARLVGGDNAVYISLIIQYSGHGRTRVPTKPYTEDPRSAVAAEAAEPGAKLILGPTGRPDTESGFIVFEDLAIELSNELADILYINNCCGAEAFYRGPAAYTHCVVGACAAHESLPELGVAGFLQSALGDGQGRMAVELPDLLRTQYQADPDSRYHHLQPKFRSLQGHELGVFVAPTSGAAPSPEQPQDSAALPWELLCTLAGTSDEHAAREFLVRLGALLASTGNSLRLAEGWATGRGTVVRLGGVGPDMQALSYLAAEGFARVTARV